MRHAGRADLTIFVVRCECDKHFSRFTHRR
nr:MAG TPA: hypothetical protein [Caudoviricetes sp.]DAP75267.1 MAG TPA: hypothetical protein [Caudoviricetes sp.]